MFIWHMLMKALLISSDDISLMYYMRRERKEKQLLLLQYSHGSRGSKSQYNNVLPFWASCGITLHAVFISYHVLSVSCSAVFVYVHV